jgi:uridine kinase
MFEGILSFYDADIRNLMDLKIFVDTDADVRYALHRFARAVSGTRLCGFNSSLTPP